ncbi:MAG: DUF2956 domain-containing protein [Gammaproteobacteria bacterium]
MAKYNPQKPSPQTQEEAMKIARATQRPAQTKEQTRLIAQGIQKGIDLYKKQQKEKAREMDRRHRKAARQKPPESVADDPRPQYHIVYRQHWLPWLLLLLSWIGLAVYILKD